MVIQESDMSYKSMIYNKRILLIHNNPTQYCLESLLDIGSHLVIAGKNLTIDKKSNVDIIDVNIFDFESLIDKIKEYHCKSNINCILPVCEASIVATGFVSETLGLNNNSVEALQKSRNKYLASIAFKRFGIPHPKTLNLNLEQALCPLELDYPIIAKLPFSTNSQSVIKADNLQELKVALKRIQKLYCATDNELNRLHSLYATNHGEVILQEYITGIELNIDLIYVNGSFLVAGVFEKAPMNGPYFPETQSVYPVSLSESQYEECFDIAKQSVLALGGTIGAAHVELRYSQRGPVIIEVALRTGGFYTALAIEKLLGHNVYQLLLYTLLHKDLAIQTVLPKSKACIYGAVNIQNRGIITSIAGLEIFNKINNLVDFKVIKKPGDYVLPLPEGSDYHIAQFILLGDSRHDVIAKAELIRSNLKIQIDDYKQ